MAGELLVHPAVESSDCPTTEVMSSTLSGIESCVFSTVGNPGKTVRSGSQLYSCDALVTKVTGSFQAETDSSTAHGELLGDLQPEYVASCQALSLAWHPIRKTLVVGWETGHLRLWNGEKDFVSMVSPHSTPVLVLKWSKMGGRLVSVDANGLMVGWRLDSRCQLLSVYKVTLPSIPCEAVFRVSRPGPDLTGLARRAVAGDQVALDIFSAWRPRTAGRQVSVHQDNMAVYVATAQGVIMYVNETGKCQEVLQYSGRIEKLLYHDTEDGLVVVGMGQNLSYYSAESDGSLNEVTTVKLSGSGNAIVWAGSGVLACTVSDTTVRCWEPSSGETYTLSAQLPDVTAQTITCLAYSSNKGVLCGCTTVGNVVFWRHTAAGWDPLPPAKVQGVAKTCTWGGSMLAVNSSSATYIMKEHNLCAAYYRGMSAVQVSASQLIVQSAGETAELNTDLQVFGVCLSREHAAVWSNRTMAVYTVAPLSTINAIGSFGCQVDSAVLYEQSLVVASTSKLQVHTLQGTVKQTLDCDGQAISLSLTGHFLTVATINGILHMWDLSRREAKIHGKAKDLVDSISDFAEVMCARTNATGTRVALSVAGANLLPLPKIYVWDMETDSMLCHSFSAQESEVSRFVVNLYWDCEEPRLLVCETRRPTTQAHSASVLRKVINQHPSSILVSLITSSEHGLLIQDTRSMSQEFVSLVAVDTPNYIVPEQTFQSAVEKILMRDFEGLENCDAATRSAVIKFSFSLIIGDIDHAFKAIHNIHSVAVWSSLARMCVKAQRLDVARICLGNMKDTRGVAALRQAEQLPEPEARVAALAVHLGMLEEAEKLYAVCGRWDLLNRLLQAQGKWRDAVKLAEEKDRIHVRHTCHWYGKHLESQGDLERAAEIVQTS
ncbi:intraflagellar transport protein 140 homolog [Homalodisca vitripennis]|uniref:intraflagellar transport protein 140 homolog n=1 Tax=Homalodisca vitripennis TaxID=197043 RepID=UPI001EEBD715|nr:intraflagellar transport protein 140 homolog [Homalodisca vitripennis]